MSQFDLRGRPWPPGEDFIERVMGVVNYGASWENIIGPLYLMVNECDALKAVLKEVIRTYVVADEAWDPEADTERIMEDRIRRYYEESNLPSGSY